MYTEVQRAENDQDSLMKNNKVGGLALKDGKFSLQHCFGDKCDKIDYKATEMKKV